MHLLSARLFYSKIIRILHGDFELFQRFTGIASLGIRENGTRADLALRTWQQNMLFSGFLIDLHVHTPSGKNTVFVTQTMTNVFLVNTLVFPHSFMKIL